MWFKRLRFNKVCNSIGTGSKIEGNIYSNSSWSIAGVLSGDLITNGNVSIESTAVICGNITGKNVQVAGKVTGNIAAKKNLFMISSCMIAGEIDYKSLEMEEGACFTGKSHSGVTLKEMEGIGGQTEERKEDWKEEHFEPFAVESAQPIKHKKVIIQ